MVIYALDIFYCNVQIYQLLFYTISYNSYVYNNHGIIFLEIPTQQPLHVESYEGTRGT